ncbi:probable cyclin-dependent serine/threonine-protein kinase DDB_G0292550 [Planococcus citri]|uniref:probable cyclin-dependent serine/threonine-protein kinase DDB_G0292550 n=1 Tax=Planococcus citri TaxID=170843 RepID=UPI0031F84990
MKYSNKIFWIFVVIVAATALFDRGNCAKLYILEENSINKVAPYSRLRRQTHPAATIAKLPTQDTGVFTPIVGPTQSSDQQFRQNTLDFSNSDTLVDYLLPPNPNAQFTSLNFQDPSANLQNIDNFFDIAPTSSSDTVNSFQPIQNQFPSSPGSFSNQINIATPNIGADSVQSLTFQNAPISASPSLSFSSPTQTSSINQFIQNKESSSLSRELNSVTQFKNPNQFKSNSNFIKNEPINFVKSDPISSDQPSQGKWDLGFDANDILAPPNPETARNEYDTINGNRFKKVNNVPSPLNNIQSPSNNLGSPNTVLPPNNFSPPNNNFLTPSNTLSPPSTQFSSNTNQFIQPNQFNQPNNQFQSNSQFFPNQFTSQQNNFNQFNAPQPTANNQFVPSNVQFTQQNPVPASNNQISVPSQISSNGDQTDIIWGTQKQVNNFIPTTSAPFLPTIPPNNNNQNSINYQQNGFNNGQSGFNSGQNGFNNGQNLQQFPSTQLNNDQIYQFPGNVNNQNYALDTPLTSQFDSFLPQGTVSDHSFFPVNENVRHFQRKRQVDEEEEHEEEVEEPLYESKSKFKTGPVYSFVKTDKNGHFKWSVRHPSRR